MAVLKVAGLMQLTSCLNNLILGLVWQPAEARLLTVHSPVFVNLESYSLRRVKELTQTRLRMSYANMPEDVF